MKKKLKVVFVGSYTVLILGKGEETILKYVVLGTEEELELYRKAQGVFLVEYENTENETDPYNGKPLHRVRALKEIEF